MFIVVMVLGLSFIKIAAFGAALTENGFVRWLIISCVICAGFGSFLGIVERKRRSINVADPEPSGTVVPTIAEYVLSWRRLHAFEAALAFAILQGALIDLNVKGWPLVIPFGGVSLLLTDYLLLTYRINRGVYGHTDYEAREIAAFILKNGVGTSPSSGLGANKPISAEPGHLSAESASAKIPV